MLVSSSEAARILGITWHEWRKLELTQHFRVFFVQNSANMITERSKRYLESDIIAYKEAMTAEPLLKKPKRRKRKLT